jgi:hypothetical protein
MSPLRPHRLLVLGLLAACDSGGSNPPDIVVQPTELRAQGLAVSADVGNGSATATALLLATASPVSHGARAGWRTADTALERRLVFHAFAHLECEALGAGGGARIDGSARIRRLAQEVGAPPDANNNGSNLDETAALELASLGSLAGAPIPDGAAPILFPWLSASAQHANPPAASKRSAYGEQRGIVLDRGSISMRQVGQMLLARVVAASALLRDSRGSRPGADPASGMLGLLWMQQAVAIEETMFESLFARPDQGGIGRLSQPGDYDPARGLRWLPNRFSAFDEPNQPSVPAGYLLVDSASDLGSLAVVLRAAAELAWLASERNPYPALRDVLNGLPFGGPRTPRRGALLRPILTDGSAALTYEDNVKPIIDRYGCAQCHAPPFPSGDFIAVTYEGLLRGGAHRATNPTVIPGQGSRSLLYQILLPNPPVSVRMPQGGPYLPSEPIQTIRDWIDQGAKRSPPSPPLIGSDLTSVCVKNLRAMHLHPSGGLRVRHEGDQGVDVARAEPTGQALSALAVAQLAMPGNDTRDLLARAADYARTYLTDAQGNVWGEAELPDVVLANAPDVTGHAAMTSGLFAAARVLGDQALEQRGRQVAATLLSRYFDPATDLFAIEVGRRDRRYTPVVLATILEALQNAAGAAVPGAADAHDRFVRRLLPILTLAEWDGLGEVLHDGRLDTDGNGIQEPAERLPLFAADLREGPPPTVFDEPITWSKHVLPLFRSTCHGCHFDNARRGNYALDTPALANVPGDSNGRFPLIVPREPEASFLYRKLVDRPPPLGDQMPLQRPPLDAHGKELVRRWILEGASAR